MRSFITAAIISLTISGSAFATPGTTPGNNSGTTPYQHTIANTTIAAAMAANATIAPTAKVIRPGDVPLFRGMDHFLQKFPQATEVNCKVKGQFTEVNFIWNGLRLQAFYDASGTPVATSRIVEPGSLPLSIQLSLKKEYSAYVVTEAIEFSDAEDEGLSYYVTVTGPKAIYLLHVSTSGTISVFKKMKQ